jgi:glycosyltransferase involved in cell wall biosynthesis
MTNPPTWRIAYLTAGAAGMYCGSCLHDNALAKAMIRRGHDTLLIPTYTPILTDEKNVSSEKLFYGGLNVYLQQISPVFRWIPNWADQFLSSPRLVSWIASKAMGTSAKNLGALTVSMLKGSRGSQRKEVRRLCDWLSTFKPNFVIFSNLLIAGCIADVKRELACPIVVILQGDDIFYDGLIEPYRTQALAELRTLAQQVDLFIVHSVDYGQRMQALLGFDSKRVSVNPLTIDIADFSEREIAPRPPDRPPTIGYLARVAPEKGLHVLVDAFVELHRSGRMQDMHLQIAGWLGPQNATYWQEQVRKLDKAGLNEFVQYHGSVDRAGKLQFLDSIDVLCVPTTYQEPKGLFVLEGLVAGVPYIQPAHGAFPEIHQRAGGGHLFDPERPSELAERLVEVLSDVESSRQLGAQGRAYVLGSASTDHEAERLEQLLASL